MKKFNFSLKRFNPTATKMGIEKTVLRGEAILIALAVVVTGAGFGLVAYTAALGAGTNTFVAIGAGVLFFVVSGLVTDYGFKQFLEDSLYELLVFFRGNWLRSAKAEAKRESIWAAVVTQFYRLLKWCAITAFAAGCFAIDLGSVMLVQGDVAKVGEVVVNIADPTTLSKSEAASVAAATAPIKAEAEQLRANIAASERRVEAANPKLLTLIKSGNGWAKGELATKKAAATAADRRALAATNTTLSATTNTAANRAAAATDAVLKQQTTAISDSEASRKAKATMWQYVGFGSKAGAVLLRLYLILAFLAAGAKDVNGDGRITGADVTAATVGSDTPQSGINVMPQLSGMQAATNLETVVASVVTTPQAAITTNATGTATVPQRQVIGFHRETPQPAEVLPQSVPQAAQRVVTLTTDHPDHAVRAAKRLLSSERANITNRNGNRDTVLRRTATKVAALKHLSVAEGVTPELAKEVASFIIEIEELAAGWV